MSCKTALRECLKEIIAKTPAKTPKTDGVPNMNTQRSKESMARKRKLATMTESELDDAKRVLQAQSDLCNASKCLNGGTPMWRLDCIEKCGLGAGETMELAKAALPLQEGVTTARDVLKVKKEVAQDRALREERLARWEAGQPAIHNGAGVALRSLRDENAKGFEWPHHSEVAAVAQLLQDRPDLSRERIVLQTEVREISLHRSLLQLKMVHLLRDKAWHERVLVKCGACAKTFEWRAKGSRMKGGTTTCPHCKGVGDFAFVRRNAEDRFELEASEEGVRLNTFLYDRWLELGGDEKTTWPI